MNWKNRFTNYNFWISIFSAVLLILQALKIEFDIAYVNEIFTAVLGLLVVIGIINDPTRISVKSTETPKKDDQKHGLKLEKKEVVEETNEKEKANEESLPTNSENEINYVDYKSDLQNIITKISADIDEKFNQLKAYNEENLKKTSILNQSKIENVQEEELPAVAENPYLDI